MPIAPTVERTLATQGVEFRLLPHPRTSSTRDTAVAAHVPADHIAKAVIVKDADLGMTGTVAGPSPSRCRPARPSRRRRTRSVSSATR